MKTLILGPTGFVGGALLRKLSKEFETTILLRHINHPIYNEYTSIIGNLRAEKTIQKIRIGNYKRVIDASWTGLPNLDSENNQKNYLLKAKLIQTFVQMGVEEYVGFGSCLEYGELIGKVSEQSEGVNVGDFGKTKLSILELLKDSGMKYYWFRPFYLIGSGQHEKSLINTAIRYHERGIDFIPKEPDKSFDFITIDEATEAINSVIEKPFHSSIYNVGSGEATSVAEVVNVIRENFGLNIREFQKSNALIADISKLTSHTGWSRKKSIQESITQIVREIRAS